MKIIIDGKEIQAEEGKSILDIALAAGIYIPHLCKHPDLEAVGGCRLCSVEIDGYEHAQPACKTMASEGMNIQINGPKAEKTRKMAMELILATHPADCTGCPKYGKCELQSMYQYLGVGPERWRKKARIVPTDESNPLVKHLFTRCIRCGRCVRACRELRGVKVLDFQHTETGIRIGTDGNVSLKEAGCKFCGACIEVCPTGSIMDAVGMIKEDRSYAESVVPCRSTCPAGVDIPRYLRYVKEGEFGNAAAVIRERVPFPEILGNVCVHECENQCKRNGLGEPVSICRVKRFAAEKDDQAWKDLIRNQDATGKRVAVIGAGPSGLTAAYYLTRKGHSVTVFEANQKAGGQCRYGIPSYRLSDELIDREIGTILESGVELKTETRIKDPQSLLTEGYDAVLVAVGTHKGTRLNMEGSTLSGTWINTDFLKKVRTGECKTIADRVMVLGGGNVAYDCARTAVRLGAKEVHIACLENEEQMTATREERLEGKEEGIILHAAHAFHRITGTDRVEGVEIQKVQKFYFDENRKPVIELVDASNEIVSVDQVIFAVGQKPEDTEEMGLTLTHGPYIQTGEDFKTSKDGIFAAGDAVTGTKSVIAAIAAGRGCAEEIDKFLGGDGDISEHLTLEKTPSPWIGRTEGFAEKERQIPDKVDAGSRKDNFNMVEKSLSCEQAQCEAARCLQCDLRLELTKPKLWNEY